MKRTVISSLIAVAVSTVAISAIGINNATAGEIIFNDAANAKIARLKTKARVLKNTRGQDVVPSALGADAEAQTDGVTEQTCGSVGIANQVKPDIGKPPVKETNVYIVGDVINTGNNCR